MTSAHATESSGFPGLLHRMRATSGCLLDLISPLGSMGTGWVNEPAVEAEIFSKEGLPRLDALGRWEGRPRCRSMPKNCQNHSRFLGCDPIFSGDFSMSKPGALTLFCCLGALPLIGCANGVGPQSHAYPTAA